MSFIQNSSTQEHFVQDGWRSKEHSAARAQS
jgi:hypothetical protein